MSGADAGNPEAAKLAAYPLFDWLRFILASLVVLSHAGLPFLPHESGGLAVDVFLALSGWLIGGILLRTKLAEVPRFFFNRSTRIWLPYAAAIVFLYGTAAVRDGIDPFWWKYLFYDATFTHQIFTVFPQALQEMPLKGSGNQFWSISVEEQFYLFAPPVMLLLPFGKRLVTWLVIAALGVALQITAAPIAFGVVAAILQRDRGDWHLKPGARAALLVVAVTAMASIAFVTAHMGVRSAMAIAVVLLAATPGERRPLPMFLGGISYPVYLNHWFGMFIAHGLARHISLLSGATVSIVGYLAGVAVGTVAYLVVDRPVMRLRDRWYSPPVGRAMGGIAYTLLAIGLVGGTIIAAR